MEGRVKWAIFSDYYGIWFADEKHQWYEKNPDTVTNEEYKKLLIYCFSPIQTKIGLKRC